MTQLGELNINFNHKHGMNKMMGRKKTGMDDFLFFICFPPAAQRNLGVQQITQVIFPLPFTLTVRPDILYDSRGNAESNLHLVTFQIAIPFDGFFF